uniref:Uncharacterized protein n=1 Tax=Panagrolaimus sp. JU765 TaxID=591449 RepID=A0AC34QW30_9BILA
MWLAPIQFAALFLIGTISARKAQVDIPGCPDLASLPGDLSQLDAEQLSNFKCFCSFPDEEDRIGIAVNCIFGSRLEDLADALMAIDDANQTVYRISLDHVQVTDSEDSATLEEVLSSDCLQNLQELEIKKCRGKLAEKRENPIVEYNFFPVLESIIIENCDLNEIPKSLISNTKLLKTLSLAGNKIIQVRQTDLEFAAQSLEFLDLTENLITKVDSEAISQLEHLKTLLIGEHNYANDSLLQQISQLPNLEILDMTRIDGMDSLSKINFGNNGKNLKQWILTGCNLKSINKTDFDGLENLQELDLRVNLIETIEPLSFSSLKSLQVLSLAGNYLREADLGPELWQGLDNLESLDLGWNEIKLLKSDAFKNLRSLKSLSLRHNEKLQQIETGAFQELSNLQFLNLSGSFLKKINKSDFEGLVSLKELHLSKSRIQSIENDSFDFLSETLEKLSMDGNNLTWLDASVLKPLHNLKEINLSMNPWLCSIQIQPMIEWVRKTYISAAESSREFFFLNSSSTLCARPYSKQGRALMDLKVEELTSYDESIDTTTQSIVSTTQVQNDLENTTFINFDDLFHIIGIEGNETLDAIEDTKKPKYDINVVRYGQKTTSKNPTNSMFATVTVTLLVIVTVFGILMIVRRNKSGQKKTEKSQNAITTTV